MSSIRFATVRDLYEAFPTAQEDVELPPNDESSLDFLNALVSKQLWNAAVAFCAYLLPRREAIWWGCQSIRRIQPNHSPHEAAALELAEAWVHAPEEERRRQALDRALASDARSPSTWMLFGVGWSGGSIVQSQHGMVPAAPQQTARAVRAGLLIALAWVPSEDKLKVAKPCMDNAIALATGEAHS